MNFTKICFNISRIVKCEQTDKHGEAKGRIFASASSDHA
jgi:hypothetical protein